MTNRGAPVFYVAIVQPGHASALRLDVTDSVVSLAFEDDEQLAQKLTLTVDNYDLSNFDNPIWRKGAVVEASWGYVGDTTPTYSCVIQSVKGFTSLSVEALAKSVLMHKKQKTRKWNSLRRSDVAKLVAAENGYGDASAQHISDSSVVLPFVQQLRETDAQFLQRLARAEGWYFHVDYDGLHFHERKLAQAPLRKYIWHGDPNAGDILGEPSIENDVTAKPAVITAVGRDPLAKKDFTVTADNDSTPRDSLADAIEVIDPQTGASTFQPAGGQEISGPSSSLNEADAKRKVQGQYRDAQMTTVKMTLPVVGDPRVRGRSIVTVDGIRSLSGNYFVAKASDSVSQSGYTQTLSLRRDGRSEIFPKAATPNAKVNTKNTDPDEGALEPLEQVDPITGATTTIYVDSRGRSQE
jgi:uncharacterized protein